MVPIAVLDACVVYPAPLRDLLIRLALAGLFRARWTEQILDEAFEALRSRRPELESARLRRTRQLMCEALPDALVEGHLGLVEDLGLPDPDDRHVLAAAIHSGAHWIVTENVKDFPAEVLADHEVEVRTPDDLVLLLLDRTPDIVIDVIRRQAAALKNPPHSFDDLLETLGRCGLGRAVTEIKRAVRERRDPSV
ncbi:MAG: PIN domain-containing protein [bacterium]|nr:PIN domain-containing protein [bacterium]